MPVELKAQKNDARWLDSDLLTEGQLSVDVYETEDKIIILSTIAGARAKDLKISLHHDILSISGTREQPKSIPADSYLYQECFWGPFSRTIILPSEVDTKKIKADLENGVLSISLIKLPSQEISIEIKE